MFDRNPRSVTIRTSGTKRTTVTKVWGLYSRSSMGRQAKTPYADLSMWLTPCLNHSEVVPKILDLPDSL